MTDFIDVTQANEKKKQLLAWLMQQAGGGGMGGGALQAAGSLGNSAAGALGFGHTIFNRSDTRHSDPAVTGMSHVGQGIAGLLGPGGRGLAGALEHSAAPGLPVLMPGHGQSSGPQSPAHRPILPGHPNLPPTAQGAPSAMAAPINPQAAGPGAQMAPGVFLDPNTLMLHGRPLTF